MLTDATPQETPPRPSLVLDAAGVAKSYGGHLVLKYVDFAIREREIVAVIGENGAGKSTFAKILAGAVQPESGELRLIGQRVDFQSPRDALRAGVSYIPQELAYLPNLTVAENILVGRWPHRRGVTSDATVRSIAAREAQKFGIEINVGRRMGELTLAERQLVEVLKALTRSSRVLVLDEPTASLTQAESTKLFATLRQLSRAGLSVIFISHRMDEIFAVSDRVVVLRNGGVVANLETASTTPAELIGHMLGEAAEELGAQHEERLFDRPALELLSWSSSGEPALRDLNVTVHRGEIACLFGLRGSGGETIGEALAGRRHDVSGKVRIAGRTLSMFRSPGESNRAGIGYVPAERKRDGLVLPLSVQANLSMLVLRSLARLGWLNRAAEQRLGEDMRNRLRIRLRSLSQSVGTLSGGNQQKVLLASRLAARPEILVLHEPTRGVDVGARFEIHQYVRSIAAEGTAVLWITTDVEEAVLVADRVLVLREGNVVAELTGTIRTQGRALAMATKDAA
jgi:ribose transport system ATP-binding protein